MGYPVSLSYLLQQTLVHHHVLSPRDTLWTVESGPYLVIIVLHAFLHRLVLVNSMPLCIPLPVEIGLIMAVFTMERRWITHVTNKPRLASRSSCKPCSRSSTATLYSFMDV